MKKVIRTVIWLVVALLALAYLVHKTPREEFTNALKQLRWGWAIAGLLTYQLSQTLLAVRWVVLLRVQGVYVSVYQAVKLTYLGLFYNNMMPGAVGGDLLKAWYITKHSGKNQRVEAAVTVFVDRLIGLIGMIFVGAIASYFVANMTIKIMGHAVQVRVLVWLILAALIISVFLFLNQSVRKVLRLGKLAARLPFTSMLTKIDQAICIYRHHSRTIVVALLISSIIQSLAIVAIWMLTQSLGLTQVTFWQCLIIMPVVWLVSAAIPVPGGLGVIENLFIPFFVAAIDPQGRALEQAAGQAAALALLNRLMLCCVSIPGAMVPVFGGHLPHAREMQEEIRETGQSPQNYT